MVVSNHSPQKRFNYGGAFTKTPKKKATPNPPLSPLPSPPPPFPPPQYHPPPKEKKGDEPKETGPPLPGGG